jgi:hypothetical protein
LEEKKSFTAVFTKLFYIETVIEWAK